MVIAFRNNYLGFPILVKMTLVFKEKRHELI